MCTPKLRKQEIENNIGTYEVKMDENQTHFSG